MTGTPETRVVVRSARPPVPGLRQGPGKLLSRVLVTGSCTLMLALTVTPSSRAKEHQPPRPVEHKGERPIESPAAGIDAEITAARAASHATPGDAAPLTRLGWLFLKKGSLGEAGEAFDAALQRSPRSGEARTGKGIVLSRKGQLSKAEQALLEALTLNPKPARAHYELGLVYQKMGDPAKALAQFKDGIRSQAAR